MTGVTRVTAAAAWARRHVWAVPLLVVAVAVALVAGAPPSTKPAYDPTSTSPNGTKALVLLLERLGVDVHTGVSQPAGAGPALILVDQLDQQDEQSLLHWVAAGHTLVVADPSSTDAGATANGDDAAQIRLDNGETLTNLCAIPALTTAARIRPYGGTPLSGPGDAVGCYREQDGDYFLLARPLGHGTVVAIGSPDPWTNANLDQADNSVLAADLLSVEGHPAVTILGASPLGAGQTGLYGLISDHVRSLVWQLVVAFVVVALWKSRRLGRPVVEDPPVVIPASELVAARGNLLQEGRHRGQAAAALRDDFARSAGRRLGVPRGAGPDALVAAAQARAGIDPGPMAALLAGPAPAGDDDLVRLARNIDQTMKVIARADSPQ